MALLCLCNSSPHKAVAGEFPQVGGQAGLCTEFKVSLNYIERHWLKTNKTCHVSSLLLFLGSYLNTCSENLGYSFSWGACRSLLFFFFSFISCWVLGIELTTSRCAYQSGTQAAELNPRPKKSPYKGDFWDR